LIAEVCSAQIKKETKKGISVFDPFFLLLFLTSSSFEEKVQRKKGIVGWREKKTKNQKPKRMLQSVDVVQFKPDFCSLSLSLSEWFRGGGKKKRAR